MVPSEAAVAHPREQPDQGVPAAVQRPAQGRQELSLHRRDAGRSVSARPRHPAPRHPGRPLLRAVHRRRPASADPRDHPAAVHRPELSRRPARASAGSGPASTITSAAASRPASGGRARRTTGGWSSDVVDFLEGRTVDVRLKVREAMLAASGARGLRARPRHARRAPLARAAGAAGQRRGDRAPATPTSSGTPATATTRSAC